MYNITRYMWKQGIKIENQRKLAKSIGIDAFERTVILIDPKAKKNEGTDAQIDSFCESL